MGERKACYACKSRILLIFWLSVLKEINGEITITPFSRHFSISSEILINFELTFFTVLACSTDNR